MGPWESFERMKKYLMFMLRLVFAVVVWSVY